MNERVLNHLRVAMENYPVKVLISKERRAKYFKPSDKLPLKYQNKQYVFKSNGKGSAQLWDTVARDWVVKNPGTAGKERYQVISGNEMFARTHERIRDKVVKTLKEYFKNQILKTLSKKGLIGAKAFEHPVQIRMELYTQFGVANWDVDNLWIYHKCFYDALVDAKVINNDNIIHVRKGGGTEFVPIPEGETTRMEFVINEFIPETNTTIATIEEDPTVEPGDIRLHVDYSSPGEPRTTILMGTGKKKVIYGAAQKAVRRAMYHCLNHFQRARVRRHTYERFQKFFECFPEHRVELIQVP